MLTKLEDQILLTVLKFKGAAYGINIYQHIEKITGSKVAVGVVYFALDRLEKRGLIQSYKGEPTTVRGGMRKKFYGITETGVEELMKSKKINDSVWKGFSSLVKVE